MATHLYVISAPDRAAQNLFKFGFHTGDKDKLLKRYRTALINPVIYLFEEGTLENEKEILYSLDEVRQMNDNENKSEWIKLDLYTLVTFIRGFLNQMETKSLYDSRDIKNEINYLLVINSVSTDDREKIKVLERLINLNFLLVNKIYNKSKAIDYFLKKLDDDKRDISLLEHNKMYPPVRIYDYNEPIAPTEEALQLKKFDLEITLEYQKILTAAIPNIYFNLVEQYGDNIPNSFAGSYLQVILSYDSKEIISYDDRTGIVVTKKGNFFAPDLRETVYEFSMQLLMGKYFQFFALRKSYKRIYFDKTTLKKIKELASASNMENAVDEFLKYAGFFYEHNGEKYYRVAFSTMVPESVLLKNFYIEAFNVLEEISKELKAKLPNSNTKK
nr:hypothetical protein K-LCC10_0499 [Kaumoebavirus]